MNTFSPETPKYSIVVPFHNEQDSIPELYRRLLEVLGGRFEPFELVFVDDHSTDRTPELLEQLAEQDPRVIALRLKRNYGQTAALAAGFDHASGEIIVSMDGDLQHDPADIPALLAAMEETGSDLVNGWRKARVDNFWLRRLPSRIANWLVARLSGLHLHDFGSGFKAYRREVIKQIPLYGDWHRFIPVLAFWHGARVVEVPIRNQERPYGQSHYGLSRTPRVLFDILTIRFLVRYLTRPLHFLGAPGLLGLLGGSGILLVLGIKKLLYGTHLFIQHGPLLLLGVMLVLFGVQLLAIGLLGELILRTYFEAHRPPIYRVERIWRSPSFTAPHAVS